MVKTKQDMNTEIVVLKAKLEKVEGTETEVYTRIVGYYRALKNWNKGRRKEYNDRLPFKFPGKEVLNERT